ncbi:MAG: LysR substrate-binding domain-containing protein, partial [Gammaproteobacteria bacterium]|nr:LysR substrate-binding domain-containing protein [Gammaproteobacteria bacterium]
MDKLRAMTAFVQIVDRGSLTAAAVVLNKSLPSVVRTLATLEGALGVRLLNRTTRRIALTNEGQHYLARCRRILADIEEAELAVSAEQREPRGNLNITAPVLFGQMHVAPLVTSFLARFNQVHVELLLLDRLVNLVEEGVDVGIRIAHLEDSSMVAIPVGQIRRVVCASPKLLKKTGVPQ